ncbi:MAG: hypoxanthine phosphoribosyltransferase [Clostridiales bacterium]|nr:hypoxanthine phosphoribosyltransferase [Clostridiales bacterium]
MSENKYGEVIISREQIQQRVRELGAQITKDYEGKKLLLVGILNGCVYFMTDLSREIDLMLQIDFMVVSSYGASTKTSGVVKIVKDLNRSIEGYDVLLVEDIIDSGLTLSYLKEYLSARNPNSIKIVTLIDKPEGRKIDIKADYVGFNVPNEFIIGYGLDYAENYRNLKDVLIIKPELI